MRYISTEGKSPAVGFREAVLSGLAPDGGLYVPEKIPSLGPLASISEMTLHDWALKLCSLFIGDEFPKKTLRELIDKALTFPTPLVSLGTEQEKPLFILELFHGPTLAFKDVGARFMAALFQHFLAESKDEYRTILVATSGDTGGAVASAFHGIPGIDVVVLYPKGRVSEIQELQLTTLGDNIQAVAVEGSFDDCQNLVKGAFKDREILARRPLASANSINLARLLPQMFYFGDALSQATRHLKQVAYPSFAVPSGNFGNLTAGVLAKLVGVPLCHFIAATNKNSVVPEFLKSGEFTPRPSLKTLSNAMDVGNPSNFARLAFLLGRKSLDWTGHIVGSVCDEDQTKDEVLRTHREKNYIIDPHGSVGIYGAKNYLTTEESKKCNAVIVLETAHYSKFLPEMEACGLQNLKLHSKLQKLSGVESQNITMPSVGSALKELLLQT